MKMCVSELSAEQLDRWVAKAENIELDAEGVATRQDGVPIIFLHDAERYAYSPSTLWVDGGPIIEREKITLQSPLFPGARWIATIPLKGIEAGHGSTALEAAMRRYVASKFGEVVDENPHQ
jgi:hypothetical protein